MSKNNNNERSLNMSGQHIMHEQHDAVLMSLSAIALMADHPYSYWKSMHELAERGDERQKRMANESIARCERVMQEVCVRLDAVMQYIGDMNNAVDAVDEHQMTDAAFAAMGRALGRPDPEDDEPYEGAPS